MYKIIALAVFVMNSASAKILGGTYDAPTGHLRLEIESQSSGINGDTAHPALVGGCFSPAINQCVFAIDVLNSAGRMALEKRILDINLLAEFRSHKLRGLAELGHAFVQAEFAKEYSYFSDDRDLVAEERKIEHRRESESGMFTFFDYLRRVYNVGQTSIRITIFDTDGTSFSFSE